MTDLMVQPHQCTARAKSTGQQCQRAAIQGGTVCYVHGGGSARVRDAAQRRLAARTLEADARAVLAYEATEPIGDPVLELALLAAEVKATVRAIGARVNALQDVRFESLTGTEQVRAELTLLGEYQDRLARMLTALGRLDLDGRRVRINEAQAAVLVAAVDQLLTHLALGPERTAEARQVFAGIVRELGREAAQ